MQRFTVRWAHIFVACLSVIFGRRQSRQDHGQAQPGTRRGESFDLLVGLARRYANFGPMKATAMWLW
jgi:hypothetical protein